MEEMRKAVAKREMEAEQEAAKSIWRELGIEFEYVHVVSYLVFAPSHAR